MEIDLWERFGWTPDELDTQDESRILPAVQAANLRQRLSNVIAFLESGGRVKPSEKDLELWKWAGETAEKLKRDN